MTPRSQYFRFTLLILLAVGLACTVRPAMAEDVAEPIAQVPITQVTLTVLDYEGVQQLIASHKGSVVVVDVWSTSCPPCLREFPGLVALDEEYGDEVACISLNLDYTGARNRTPEDYRGRVTTWLERFGATFENVLAAEGTDDMLEHLDLAAPPGVYVYNADGELVQQFDNTGISGPEEEFTYADVGALVAELVGQDQPE